MAGKTPKRRRDVQITVRLSEAEYAAFRQRADELELALTTWLRLIARREVGLPSL